MLLSWLLLFVMTKGAVTQDETVSIYTKFNATLPSRNNDKIPLPGASFQVWYKGSTEAEDSILYYTLPSGPLTKVNDSDVRHGFDTSSAALLIYDINANDAGTYYYVEGLHNFSVLLNLTALDSMVLSNSIQIQSSHAEETETGVFQVNVTVDDQLEIVINTIDIDGESPRLAIKEDSEIQNDDGSPGVLVFAPDTSTAGTNSYAVEATLFDVVGMVSMKVIIQESSPCSTINVPNPNIKTKWIEGETTLQIKKMSTNGGEVPNTKVMKYGDEELMDCEDNQDTYSCSVSERDLNWGENHYVVSASWHDSDSTQCMNCTITYAGVSTAGVFVIIIIILAAAGIVVGITLLVLKLNGNICKKTVKDHELAEDDKPEKPAQEGETEQN